MKHNTKEFRTMIPQVGLGFTLQHQLSSSYKYCHLHSNIDKIVEPVVVRPILNDSCRRRSSLSLGCPRNKMSSVSTLAFQVPSSHAPRYDDTCTSPSYQTAILSYIWGSRR